MSKTKNTGIAKTIDNGKGAPKGPSKIDQATKLINAASNAVGTGTDVFSTVSDFVEKRDQKYLSDNCSRIPEKRTQLVAHAVSTKALSWEQAEEKLAAIERDEVREKVLLMQARDNSRRVRAQNAKDWGKGIGFGTTGASILAGILYLIFGRKKAA